MDIPANLGIFKQTQIDAQSIGETEKSYDSTRRNILEEFIK
jgi:hypothetical protein